MWKNNDIGCGGIILMLVIAVFFWLIGPAIGYFDGWIVGHVCRELFGSTLINGLNTVFNTAFTAEQLPTIFGTLGMVGGFFKGSSAVSKTVSKWDK